MPVIEGMNTATVKKVEKILHKMHMTDEEGDVLFSLIAKKGGDKGIAEFVKGHSKFKKYQDELELVADAMGY